jgi:hypothetical protein
MGIGLSSIDSGIAGEAVVDGYAVRADTRL